MHHRHRRSLILGLGAPLVVSGCYIHTHAEMLESAARRAPTCPAAVRIFADSSDVTQPYVVIARISIWVPADMVAPPGGEQSAMREKAASVGANGLILGHPLDTPQFVAGRDLGKAIAVFILGDSARAAAACARGA